ncbi:MAG: YggS family pyridoxal phosphate-dependent enzyme [Oscillospiraceae bacterium]|nr:YggS family pyridoxal phosphate-dependent enzyme [Oscillospiraceae bacterium]
MANDGTPYAEQIEAMRKRLSEIRGKITAACAAAGRSADEVTLMAVTKTVDPVLINAAVDAGVTVLGENRVQEFLSKREQYRPDADVQFIGHLQTNKVKQIIDKVSLIHSVDSPHLADAIQKAAAAAGIVMPVLIEVNIGGEDSKSGVEPDAAEALLRYVQQLPNLRADGLMTIPPPLPDEEEQNRVFSQMRQLYDTLREQTPLRILSMGMSGDYEAAIRNGATLVRIGSALFGARIYPQQTA